MLSMAAAITSTLSTAAAPSGSLKQEQPKLDESMSQKAVPFLQGEVSDTWTSGGLGFNYKYRTGIAVIDQVKPGSQAWKLGLKAGDEIVDFQQESPTGAYMDVRRDNRVYRATIAQNVHPILTGSVRKNDSPGSLTQLYAKSAPSPLAGQIQSSGNNPIPARIIDITPPPGYQPPDFHIAINRGPAGSPWYVFNPLDPVQRKAAMDWGYAGFDQWFKHP